MPKQLYKQFSLVQVQFNRQKQLFQVIQFSQRKALEKISSLWLKLLINWKWLLDLSLLFICDPPLKQLLLLFVFEGGQTSIFFYCCNIVFFHPVIRCFVIWKSLLIICTFLNIQTLRLLVALSNNGGADFKSFTMSHVLRHRTLSEARRRIILFIGKFHSTRS